MVVKLIDELLAEGLALLLGRLDKGYENIMASLADIQADLVALQAGQAREDVLIGGMTTQLAGLQADLATAIANSDPTALQAVHDGLGEIITDMANIAPIGVAPSTSSSTVQPVTSATVSNGGTSSQTSSGTATTDAATVSSGGTATTSAVGLARDGKVDPAVVASAGTAS